jgi:HK97 family phage major capsid protein
MFIKVNELKAQRAGKIDAMETLVGKMGADDYVEDEVDTQVYEELKGEVAALDKKIERADQVEKLKASLAKPVDGQDRATGTPPRIPAQALKRYTKLKAYKGDGAMERAYRVGQWIRGSIFGDDEARQWCRDNGITITRAQSEGVNSAGGFLVPTEMMDSIIDLREEYGVFRQYAELVPMSSDTLDWPRRSGGLTAYFTAEGAAATESSASWDNVSLVAKKIAVLTRISNELSEDAIISVADKMTQEIAYAFAVKEDACGFNGDGTSTYGGIRGVTQLLIDNSHNAGKVAATTGHDTFAEIDATDLTNLMGKLPKYAMPRAKFYCSQLAFATVFERLVASAGGNSTSTLSGEIQYRYLGFPIIISQTLPAVSTTLANAIMLLFGDLALAAAVGERRVATIRKSDDRYFEQDQVGILGTERVDIVVHDAGDNTTAGPIVGLMGN